MKNKTAVLAVLLFLSLALNLFFTGQMLSGPGRHAEWMRRGGELAKKLPAADRAILKAEMKKNREKFDTLRKEMGDRRAAVRAAIESGQGSALDAALKAETKARAALFHLIQDTRAAAAKSFSPEGKAVMAAKPAP